MCPGGDGLLQRDLFHHVLGPSITHDMYVQPVEAGDQPGAPRMFHNRAQYMFVLAPSRTVVAYSKAPEGMAVPPHIPQQRATDSLPSESR